MAFVEEGVGESVVEFEEGPMNECVSGIGEAATAVRVDNLELVDGEGLGVVIERTTVVGALVVRELVVVELELRVELVELDVRFELELELEPERDVVVGELLILTPADAKDASSLMYGLQLSGYVAFITPVKLGQSSERLDNGVGPPLQLIQSVLRYQEVKDGNAHRHSYVVSVGLDGHEPSELRV